MENVTVLITGAGGPGYPGFYKALKSSKRYKVRIVAADLNPYAGNMYRQDWVDTAYHIPANTSSDFLPALFEIITTESVTFLISGIDEEMPLLSENRAKFLDLGCEFVLPPGEALEHAFDKGVTHEMLNGIVRMPATILHRPGMDLDRAFGELGGTAVVKARRSRGNRHIYIADTEEEFKFYAHKLDRIGIPFLFQEFIEGDEFNVSLMYDKDGQCLYSVCRQKMDPPERRPNTNAGLIRRDRRMEEAAVTATRVLGLIPGPSNVEFIRNKNGLTYMIEVNGGRHAAQDYNLVHTGINIPEMLLDMSRGERVPVVPEDLIREGTFCLKYLDELIVDFDCIGKRVRKVTLK